MKKDKCRIVAFANHKGGVGKTTTVASVGAALAARGCRTLLVDTDSQANLTDSLLGDAQQERTIYEALKERQLLPVVQLKENLSIVPSSMKMIGAELDMAKEQDRETILRDLLFYHTKMYDAILIDCPPSIGLVTVNALAAADEVYIPLTAETLPVRGMQMMQDIIDMTKENLNSDLRLSGIIITQWADRKLNRTVEDQLRAIYGDLVFKTKIRKNIAVAEAPLFQQDIFTYNPTCNGAIDYKELTDEMMARWAGKTAE